MMNITKENKIIVYADDTTVLVKGRNLTETKQHCNDILQRFYDYFCLNKLSVNPSKTNYSNSSFKGSMAIFEAFGCLRL